MEKRKDSGLIAIAGLAMFLGGIWVEFGATYVLMLTGFCMMFMDRRAV